MDPVARLRAAVSGQRSCSFRALMVTLELNPHGIQRPPDPAAGLGASGRRASGALAIALLVVTTYAIFANGAIQAPAEPRLQVAVALVAAVALAAWLWTGSLRLAAPRTAVAGVLLLACFALWSAVTLAWSVAPDLTWIEFNRIAAYVIVLGLAVTLGASNGRSLAMVLYGFLGVSVLVTLYALGQKLLPGFQVGGLIDLDQTGKIARLQQPLGYWNALALLLAMSGPAALAAACRKDSPPLHRLAALVALQLMILALAFTYSRGGVIAFVVGLAAYIALSGAPLRTLMWAATAGLGAVAPLILGLTAAPLAMNGISLGRRESAGALLLVVVVACAIVLWIGAERLIAMEETVRLTPALRARTIRVLLGAAGALVLIGLVALALSSRGLTGTISHLWASFTATRGISVSNPNRLLSADSANRWVWWKEAAGAFSARPFTGWGAGSFPVVHLLFRRDTLTVDHPHSVPLQWLAETGLIGTLLAISGWGLLLRTGFSAVLRRGADSRRLVAAGLLAGALAYTLHAFYDWDWDIPGVTLPALVLLGVLAGSLRARVDPRALAPAGPGPLLRLLTLAASVLALCVFALSAIVPSIASSRASAALVAASGSTPASLRDAEQDALSAASLDPLSPAGPAALATVAEHRGDPALAREYLLEAVRRQPSDGQAWGSIAVLDLELGDLQQARRAAQNVLDLSPFDSGARALALSVTQQADLAQTPPRASATATPTP